MILHCVISFQLSDELQHFQLLVEHSIQCFIALLHLSIEETLVVCISGAWFLHRKVMPTSQQVEGPRADNIRFWQLPYWIEIKLYLIQCRHRSTCCKNKTKQKKINQTKKVMAYFTFRFKCNLLIHKKTLLVENWILNYYSLCPARARDPCSEHVSGAIIPCLF